MSTFLSTARPGIQFGEYPQRAEIKTLSDFDLKGKNLLASAKTKLSLIHI